VIQRRHSNVLYPCRRLREEGYDVHIAAPSRTALRLLVHDGVERDGSTAVIDGNMVCAREWPDHPAWLRTFVGLLRAHAQLLGASPATAGQAG